jgi:hypothetical protein
MIKATLTAATIAVAVVVPVSTASAATASPQVHTVVTSGPYMSYEACTYAGSTLMFTEGSTGYTCYPVDGGYEGYLLDSYYD